MIKINEKTEESFSALHDLEELETLDTDGSITEYDKLIRGDEDCEGNITEILNQTITKIQSSERGFKRKYEKLQEVKDEVLEGRKELEAKIQVITENYVWPFVGRL